MVDMTARGTLHPIMFLLNHHQLSTNLHNALTLHPIMFLLNLNDFIKLAVTEKSLHPIMFLLTPPYFFEYALYSDDFTSHYVPIKSYIAYMPCIVSFPLHPIMFLLNLRGQTIYQRKHTFTSHYVPIKSI